MAKTLSELYKKIETFETDNYISDMSEKESKEVALLCLEWFIDNKLDEDLLDYFLSKVKDNEK